MEFLSSPRFTALGLPFSEAVRVGDVLHLSGQIGNLPGTLTLAPGGIEAETRQTLANIAATLAHHGLGLDAVFKCTVMLADMAEWPAFNRVYLEHFDRTRLPARSAFGTRGLAMGARVELEALAYMPARAGAV